MSLMFNVSLIVKDKVTRQCPQATTFEEKGEPKRIRTEGLLGTGRRGAEGDCIPITTLSPPE